MGDIGQIDYQIDLGEHSFVAYVGGGYEITKNGERWLDRADCFSLEGTLAIQALMSYAHVLEQAHNPPPAKNPLVLHAALEASLKLQSHYAVLLNAYDGGQRRQFETAEDWITRLGVIAGIKRAGSAEHALAEA